MNQFKTDMQDEEIKHVFYSVIGRHAGESVDEIIQRKEEEIERAGFSLWSAKIDKMSIAQIKELDPDEGVWVLCKISATAKDPAAGTSKRATSMIFPTGEVKEIPDGVNTTYGTNRNSYQAYVVKRYLEVDDPTYEFDFAKYETTKSGGEVESFEHRFNKFSRFQNTYGKYNENLTAPCKKPIQYIMELEYPFVVTIK